MQGTIRITIKALLYSTIGVCLLGAYNAAINHDMSIFQGLFGTAQYLLRFIGDMIIGGDTRTRAIRV